MSRNHECSAKGDCAASVDEACALTGDELAADFKLPRSHAAFWPRLPQQSAAPGAPTRFLPTNLRDEAYPFRARLFDRRSLLGS